MTFFERLFQKCAGWLGLGIGLPVALVLRAIRPIVEVRYGFFFVDRIGHFVFDLEYHLSELALNPKRNRQIDLFFLEGDVCNVALANMMKRQLLINPLVRYLFKAEELIPGRRCLIYPARMRSGSTDHTGVFSSTPVQLRFSTDEEREGENYLRSLNCPLDAKIVCLIVRDSTYLDTTRPGKNWRYHSYRDTSLENYASTALMLAKKGYWVFRMGKVVEKRFNLKHPRIVDYANSESRSDLLDVWLLARCFFTISTSTGLDSVADAFRKPIAFVNFLPLAWFQTWTHCVLAPCHLYWHDSGRELTCEEHFANSYLRTADYEAAGIEVKELSGDEIVEVVGELDNELASAELSNLTDQGEQEEFRKLLRRTLGGCLEVGVMSVLPQERRVPSADNVLINRNARLSRTFLDKAPYFLDLQ